MKRLKRITAIVLTLIMTAVMLPVTAFASGNENETELLPIEGSAITVGEGVTAEFDEETGTLEFSSNGGELWHNWYDYCAQDSRDIKHIKAAASSGTIYLPMDSSELFKLLPNLADADLRKFDTSNVTDMVGMFWMCENLETVNLSSFDTVNVYDMSYMFFGCKSLRKLDLSNFDASGVIKMNSPLHNCSALEILKTPQNLSMDADLGSSMYDADGNTYYQLPKFTGSIRLGSNAKLAYEFTDVTDMASWYYDAVYWAYNNDYTAGYGTGTFSPNTLITRGQAVTFLHNLADKPDASVYEDPGFSDVSENDWFYNPVRWAYAQKITSGYGPGTFQPYAVCTRAMIVTFLRNWAEETGFYIEPTTSSDFTDVPEDAWYKTAVDWAVENNITSGYGEGTFQPNATCTRAMMVVFLKKVAELKAAS